MKVSVIIPVYNAEQFLTDAIASALNQEETAEIILVEDGSPDDSLAICEHFAERHPHIRLLRHPDGRNHGASASRNLGIRHARYPYLAFLDADDMYVENRFKGAAHVFAHYADADGVHESIGVQYYDEEMREMHISRIGREITGVVKFIHPGQLFRTLATGKFGHVSLDGVVLKREALDETLMFDPDLTQCEDTDLMLRLAASRTLYSGDLTRVVALRGVHRDNRVFDSEESNEFKRRYLRKCIEHRFYGSRDAAANFYIVARYVASTHFFRPFARIGGLAQIARLLLVSGFLILHPGVLVHLLRGALRGPPRLAPIEMAPLHLEQTAR
ncbi:MAG: glycosyltransferase family 2 protein [Saprospiraceae bacterium]|nr:glycosyltransferase family 2 protein [Saprospiraceae bacterium]